MAAGCALYGVVKGRKKKKHAQLSHIVVRVIALLATAVCGSGKPVVYNRKKEAFLVDRSNLFASVKHSFPHL